MHVWRIAATASERYGSPVMVADRRSCVVAAPGGDAVSPDGAAKTDGWGAGARPAPAAVVRVLGAVALPEAQHLEQRALRAVRAGHRCVTIDLTRVTAVEAGLLGALLRIRRELAGVDGELVLMLDGPPASAVVSTAQLDALSHVSIVARRARVR